MSICELEIGSAWTAHQRRYLYWELLARDQVCGVFPTTRGDVLTVRHHRDRRDFRTWAHSLSWESVR